MSQKTKETLTLVCGVIAVLIAALWLYLQIHVWEAQSYHVGWLAFRILGALFLLGFVLYAIVENWRNSRKAKAIIAQYTSPTIPPLSELEIQSRISIFPHQNTATVWLNQAGSLRFDGCVVIHNCSHEQMKALSLQNLKITLGQNTVLFSDHTINIRVEVGPRVFHQHLFSIDLHEDQAEKIQEKFHGVDSREFVEIFVSGKLVFSYAGKEHTKSVGMVFNTEARR